MLNGGHQRTRRLTTGARICAARDRVPLEEGDPLPIRGSQLELKGPRRVGDALGEVEREQAPRQGNRRPWSIEICLRELRHEGLSNVFLERLAVRRREAPFSRHFISR